MKKISQIAAGIAFVLAAGTALAQESAQVLVTEGHAKGAGRTYAVDFYSDGTAVGFNVDLSVGGLDASKIDLSQCKKLVLKDKATTGGCSFTEGVVRFVGVNTDLRPLPKGWHNLGAFGVSSLPKGGVVQTKVVATNAEGRAVDVGYEYAADK